MIDLDEDRRVSGNTFAGEFLQHVLNELRVSRRMSVLVRVRLGLDAHDFHITYKGPSRTKRRPSMTDSNRST